MNGLIDWSRPQYQFVSFQTRNKERKRSYTTRSVGIRNLELRKYSHYYFPAQTKVYQKPTVIARNENTKFLLFLERLVFIFIFVKSKIARGQSNFRLSGKSV